MPKSTLDKLQQELRRGTIVLAVLGQLREEHYGYSLRKALMAHGLSVDEGTLYPLIRRLENQGLLHSDWREENKRRKRFYRLSAEGEVVFEHLARDWRQVNSSLQSLMEDTDTCDG